jgi:hypothetical protein
MFRQSYVTEYFDFDKLLPDLSYILGGRKMGRLKSAATLRLAAAAVCVAARVNPSADRAPAVTVMSFVGCILDNRSLMPGSSQ